MGTPFGAAMATQFTPHGDGFLFRQGGKGPPLPCTRAERDRFIRHADIMFLVAVPLFMLGVIGAAVVTAQFYPRGNEPGGFAVMGGGLVLVVAALILGVRRVMQAPARLLAGRTP